MENSPLVSVITVCLNAEKTIEQTILSVLNQTYKNIEYIIIDGGSKDSTLNIIDKYKSQIAYYISEKDKGIYNAMNKGISRAKGVLIGIVNADDFYEPQAVEINVNEYLNKGDDKDNTCYYGMLRIWKNNLEYCVRQFHHNFVTETAIQHPTCFIPNLLYKRLGGYDESYQVCADFEFLNRLRINEVNFCKIDKIISNFRIGGATTVLAQKVMMEPYKIQLKYGIINQETFNKAKREWIKMRIKNNIRKIILFWR